MMRSMYAGVSGLRVHQNKMDVIGNNIANVNTIGYKKNTMTFQEVFSQVIRGASAPQGGRGGTNPQQIGLGVNIGSINTIHTKGPAQRTDNPEDLMIDGEGFFVVSDDTNFENRYYTRAGNFTLDRDGNLVTADGYKVLGYLANEEGNITSEVGGIRVNKSETKAPTATEKIYFEGNLDSRNEEGDSGAYKADTVIKDSLGNSYIITFKFVKRQSEGEGEEKVHNWTMSLDRITEQSTGNYVEVPAGVLEGDSLGLTFDANGKLIEIGDKPVKGDNVEDFTVKLTNLNGIKFDRNKAGDKIGEIEPSGNFKDITIFDSNNSDSYRLLTQHANDMDAKPHAKDGNSSGKLEGYSIDATGTVLGVFTNGERKALGQIILAKFDNSMGLQKIGNNFFVDTRNSGEPQFGKAASSGYGPIAAGTLEMSNVDLSMEFTEMITTQRGFQANSRIITTSDEMLQELVNMKR
ncbi:flagellar hook protein FlgE [Clostridium sp. Cult3]|uniref:flagellar hook protein FlgE n=1 Tax=Clostridium sp. Cult3 TaxID=2079004 RepID=UPI001F2BDC8B|nr:flagellar hook protein FlgE [Clostridium sp. Cult3]MCF6460541.1 flagellar hook protein FlgE [Clostridium sp. Cult3]